VLVLTRKEREEIAIGDDITIVVMQIKGKQVRLGIKASPNISVHRGEVYQRILEENRAASVPDTATVAQAGLIFSKPPEARPSTIRRIVRPAKPEGDGDE
jgi:carbon storage regulator